MASNADAAPEHPAKAGEGGKEGGEDGEEEEKKKTTKKKARKKKKEGEKEGKGEGDADAADGAKAKTPKKAKPKNPMDETWECGTCRRVNPCLQLVPGTKMIVEVENCSVCATERPRRTVDEDGGPAGPSQAELAQQQLDEMKAKMKQGLIAAWNKKKREREAKLKKELESIKAIPAARTCLKPVLPGPAPKKVPFLFIDEKMEPGALVTFVCRHGLNGSPTRRVPVGETCPYCRHLAEKRLWAWLQGNYVYARSFQEMEFGETQTVRYWGTKPVGAERAPPKIDFAAEALKKQKKEMAKAKRKALRGGISSSDEEEEEESLQDRYAREKLVRETHDSKIAQEMSGEKFVAETFDYRNWEDTLKRLNEKDTFNEVTLLCLAFEPSTFWNAIRYYKEASDLETAAREARQRGVTSPGDENRVRSPTLHVQIVRSTGLLKADYFGLSDPYCVVYFNDKEVGRTPIVPDNLDPEWGGEDAKFSIDTTGVDWCVSRLRVDVWDSDFMVQNPVTDDFLGQCRLAGQSLQDVIAKTDKHYARLKAQGAHRRQKKLKQSLHVMKLERKRGELSPLERKDADVKVKGTLTFELRLETPAPTPKERRMLKKRPERGEGPWAVACRSWREQALKKWDGNFCAFEAMYREFGAAMKLPRLLEPVLVGVFAKQDEVEDFAALAKNTRANAEIDDPGPNGYTVLHLAIQKNLPEIAEILVTAGAAIDPFDSSGATPLHVACANGYTECALMLQRLGADVFCKDRSRNDAFDVCQGASMRETAVALSKALNFEEEILWRARRYFRDLMSGRADMYDTRHLTRRHDQGKMLACAFAMRKTKLTKKTFKDPKYIRKEFCVADLYDPDKIHEIGMALFGHKPTTVPTWSTLVRNWKSVGDREDKRAKRLKSLRATYIHVLGFLPANPLKGMEGGVEEFMSRLDWASDNIYDVWLKKKGTPELDIEFEMNFGKKKGQKRAESALADLLNKNKKNKKKKKKDKKKKK